MTLAPERIAALKQASLQAAYAAAQGITAPTVGELHKAALEAAASVRAKNELAYVSARVVNDDDSAFRIVIDLSAGKGDSFYIDFQVTETEGGYQSSFVGSGDVQD